MIRVAYAIILGLIGAGIVHIAMLFLLPAMSPRDAWSRMAEQSGLYQVKPYASTSAIAGQAGVADPFFRAVACRFDLADGGVRLAGTGVVPFWSASVYDRNGQNIYSLNDRSATGGQLDLVVLTPEQMMDTRRQPLEDLQRSTFVETPVGEGIVVVRAFAPDDSWIASVSSYLAALECTAGVL